MHRKDIFKVNFETDQNFPGFVKVEEVSGIFTIYEFGNAAYISDNRLLIQYVLKDIQGTKTPLKGRS